MSGRQFSYCGAQPLRQQCDCDLSHPAQYPGAVHRWHVAVDVGDQMDVGLQKPGRQVMQCL